MLISKNLHRIISRLSIATQEAIEACIIVLGSLSNNNGDGGGSIILSGI